MTEVKTEAGQNDRLLKRIGETELQNRIQELEKQLSKAKQSLSDLGGEVDSSAIVSLAKRGYLFKWQDREVGWGGTKWALRFVALEGGKISYFGDHTEPSPRYVLTLRDCAVRDEGFKKNKRHKQPKGVDAPIDEVGAYFHVFSIYQRTNDDDYDDEPREVVPLLRFSTPSLAEKTQWVKLISEACEYCDTDEFIAAELAASVEIEKRRAQEKEMRLTMPESRPGTLPPLFFAPPPPPAPKKQRGVPRAESHRRLYRTMSGNLDAEKVESRSTKGYPPSKPMHRKAEPSYLSADGPPQSYRGFFNLAMILLVVSNFRLLLDTIGRHGFILSQLPQLVPSFARDPWADFPFFSGFLLFQVFMIITYLIERMLSKKVLGENFGMFLHHLNAHSCLFVSIAIVWHLIDKPAIGAILLVHAVITWLKLLSYMHANQDYRLSKEIDTYKATLALVEDLDLADADISYPRNITLSNMYYFWFAPTLTYQIAFPRTPRVRVWKLIGISLRMFFLTSLLVLLVAQVTAPNLKSLIEEAADEFTGDGVYNPTILAKYGLKLALANTYAWLFFFYLYFHLFLNLMAEILRFGDRVFYKDWWNSAEVSAYWRLWNMPVHYWLVRHLYFPCVRMGMSGPGATFVVFLLSAVMHELLISIPFHMIRPWSFLGMIMQIPLVGITKAICRKMPGSSIGNVLFWISFCVVGQPMAILLYTIDFQFRKQTGETAVDQMCRVPWKFWVNRCANGQLSHGEL